MRFCFFVVCLLLAEASGAEKSFALDQWAVEQMPGGTVTVRDRALVIEDSGGCTVWWREKITAPVTITYEATVVDAGGPRDRVSDLNCFWMARERASNDPPFAAKPARTGKFSNYDSLLTYYVGYGGNSNTTTRFRRYDGTAARPLLPEHDQATKSVLLEANRTYRIKLVARDGRAEFYRDGERIFTFTDPAPLVSGWFAIRTVSSHVVIRNLKIEHGAR